MDRTDVSLCLFLMQNSRTPYHELAARLGLSINAVHKRITALVDSGIIEAFTAHQSLLSLGAVTVWVYGRSEAAHPEDVHARVQADEHTYWVANSGGGYVYVGGYLRSLSELDRFVESIKEKAEMVDPTVGIMPVMSNRPTEGLRPLDYQVLNSLRRNSRKPASEVAVEVNASAKTVHRRLEKMIEGGLVDFGLDWYPDKSNDFVSLCHVEVAQRADRLVVLEGLRKMLPQNIIVEVLFSNLPNLIILFLWTNSMKQMEDLRERIGREPGVGSVMLNVLQIGYIFETWRDKLPIEGTTQGSKGH
jgi:DNA-binding Lrp family transcriptional regulator